MKQFDWSLLALQLGVIMMSALALGHLFRKLGQPSICGELLGGILLGPTLLGRFSPESYQWLFPAEGPTGDARNAVLRIGMLFFIFTIGADISLKQAMGVRKEALSIGLLGTFTPLLLGFGMALGLPGILKPPPGQEVALAGFLGAILSLSANPVIARILIDLDLYKSRIGTLIMSSTLVDDFVGWGIFAVLLAQFAPGRKAAGGPLWTVFLVVCVVAGILLIGRLVMPHVVRRVRGWSGGTMTVLMVLMGFTLLSASVAEAVGVHSFLGAFLAGLSLSDNVDDFRDAFDAASQFALAVFTPMFFFCMGIAADFYVGFDLALVALVTFVAFFGKILGVYVGGRFAGLTHQEGMAVGAGLNARGILGLIMAQSAFESRLIDERMYVACVVMCLATTIAAGPALKWIMTGRLLPIPEGKTA